MQAHPDQMRDGTLIQSLEKAYPVWLITACVASAEVPARSKSKLDRAARWIQQNLVWDAKMSM